MHLASVGEPHIVVEGASIALLSTVSPYLARVPGVERNVALGLDLLKLRSAIKNNRAYGRQVRRQFDVETKLAVNALKVARIYGAKPEIYTRLSWNALVTTLACPTLSAATREALERRILAGERIGAPESVQPPGRPGPASGSTRPRSGRSEWAA